MLFAFSVAPTAANGPNSDDPDSDDPDSDNADGSVAAAVAEAIRVVRESGVSHRTDAMFTTLEGEWDECMDVIKRACEAVGQQSTRVSLVIKADIRPGHFGQLDAKIDRINEILD